MYYTELDSVWLSFVLLSTCLCMEGKTILGVEKKYRHWITSMFFKGINHFAVNGGNGCSALEPNNLWVLVIYEWKKEGN